MADDQFTGYVYVISNTVNGKQYVGQTTLGAQARWAEHQRRAAKRLKECSALYPAIQRYGAAAFRVQEVGRVVGGTQADLDALERKWIADIGTLSPNGYNLTAGGFGGGPLHPQTKAILSALNRGRIRSASEREKTGAALRGRKRPAEVVAKVRAANLGKKRTPEQCAAIGASHRGRVPSAETREKLRAAMKGRQFTPEWRAKISAAKKGKPSKLLGRKRPPEVGAKVSASQRGRSNFWARWPRSEEFKARLSAACKAGWARKRAAEMASVSLLDYQ